MSLLLFCVPNVLWVTLRHGGLSTVPSIRVTWEDKNQNKQHQAYGQLKLCVTVQIELQTGQILFTLMKSWHLKTDTPRYLNVHVLWWHIDKGGEALAEPHCDLPFHVDSKGLKAFLETTHGVILESTGVLAKIHTSNLRYTQTAHRDETWRTNIGCERKIIIRSSYPLLKSVWFLPE